MIDDTWMQSSTLHHHFVCYSAGSLQAAFILAAILLDAPVYTCTTIKPFDKQFLPMLCTCAPSPNQEILALPARKFPTSDELLCLACGAVDVAKGWLDKHLTNHPQQKDDLGKLPSWLHRWNCHSLISSPRG